MRRYRVTFRVGGKKFTRHVRAATAQDAERQAIAIATVATLNPTMGAAVLECVTLGRVL